MIRTTTATTPPPAPVPDPVPGQMADLMRRIVHSGRVCDRDALRAEFTDEEIDAYWQVARGIAMRAEREAGR